MTHAIRNFTFALVASISLTAAFAQSPAQLESPSVRTAIPRAQPVVAQRGMVVAQEARAARIGVDVLRRGGNAVDAAVAVGFAMAVTYPRAGNLGGGGFMTIHLADRRVQTTIDYRETAPAATTRDIFLDEKGEADPRKSRDSALAVGVPGTVAGLALAHEKYGSGKLTLAELIAPAIALARDGIPVEDDVADSLPSMERRFARWPATARIFLHPDGTALRPGETLVQHDLADSLALIARDGPAGFYTGPTAQKLAAALRNAGGIMTEDDLANYRAVERAPIRGTYRGYDIVSMPPPSSGGIVLVEMLNILEGYALGGFDEPQRLHVMIEAMKRAYADRAIFLGDPNVVQAPIDLLTSKAYAAQARARIDPGRAAPAASLGRLDAPPREGDNTTHYSVIDSAGNAVANTYTLNFSYGLGMVAEGTGVLLNNELDDFAAKPGAANSYGLTGGEANAPGPGKRPLSSMSPTILLRDGRPVLITGSPGGARIITAVLQIIANIVDRKMPLAEAIAAPRIHHQWLPETVFAEPGISSETIQALAALGHRVVNGAPTTSTNSIAITPDGIVGAADPRTRGALAVGD